MSFFFSSHNSKRIDANIGASTFVWMISRGTTNTKERDVERK